MGRTFYGARTTQRTKNSFVGPDCRAQATAVLQTHGSRARAKKRLPLIHADMGNGAISGTSLSRVNRVR